MSAPSTNATQYREVMQANVEVHTRMAATYNTEEPHYRPENVANVRAKLERVFSETAAQRLLDLGCGTGFIIDIARPYVREIVGVDITDAMLERVQREGSAKVTLVKADTGSVEVDEGTFDVATAYSFLHHLFDVRPTLRTAYRALKPGGKLYADLEPNYYFWEAVNGLQRDGDYDPIVKREIEQVTYKNEDVEKRFGVTKDTFSHAEYGKDFAGGFREDELRRQLHEAGFSSVEYFYAWFLGQGQLINDPAYEREERFRYAEVMHGMLQRAWPLSRHLFKYVGFIATK